jgi:predicted ATPase
VIAHWEYEAGFTHGDTGADKFCKLAARLLPTGAATTDIALIADLLALPLGEGYAPVELSPQRRKQRTLNALMSPLVALARRQPVLVLFEDAHWTDPSSLELLDGLVGGALAELPILLVISYRPEFVTPWVGSAGVSLMTLSRLSQREAGLLAAHLTRGHATQPGLLERIVAQADGVPLFLEELTKSLMEGGTATETTVPPTLRSSLMARLDRIPSGKQVAQVAAVIGREFMLELLTAVASMPEEQLAAGLDQLVESGLVLRHGSPPDAVYTFKHALVQEVAYDSLLRSRRCHIHASIVGAMESESSIDALLTAR